ncbi:MAG: nicotinamide-nucleotide amidohydrolase family protein, partial [Desulfobacterales bacterium]
VLPRLTSLQGHGRMFYLAKTLATFGLTESLTGERLAGFEDAFPGIKLGLRAKFPEIQVKLYGRGPDERQLREQLDHATQRVAQRMGNKVFSENGDAMEKIVGDLLRQKRATLALAESCTGGLIAHLLTNVPGSSDYLLFAGVTYSNQSKIKVLNVSSTTLERYGAVHEETAKEMAQGARLIAGATYGLATSGIAGPTGGTDEKPVGTVCIGLATPTGTFGHRYHLYFGSRSMHKQIFAMAALDRLRRALLGIRKDG